MFPEYSYIVPPTLDKMYECQVIRKIISNCESSDKAIEAFKNWKSPPQDVGVVVRFDDEQIKDRDYHECHDTAQRWLASGALFRTSQIRQKVMPLLRNAPLGMTVFKYQQ
jgi:hypothetical protein